jgi:hypothetical protein
MQNGKYTGGDAKYNNKTALEWAETQGRAEAAQAIRAGTLSTTHAINNYLY